MLVRSQDQFGDRWFATHERFLMDTDMFRMIGDMRIWENLDCDNRMGQIDLKEETISGREMIWVLHESNNCCAIRLVERHW